MSAAAAWKGPKLPSSYLAVSGTGMQNPRVARFDAQDRKARVGTAGKATPLSRRAKRKKKKVGQVSARRQRRPLPR
jgi:hypothetical protein